MLNVRRFFPPLFFIILVDQLTKFLFYQSRGGSLNNGISFSFFPSSTFLGQTFLILTMMIFVLFLFRQFGQKYPFLTGLILGGAVSNVIDRILLGGVRDFLPVPFLPVQNNMADWGIFVGLVGIGLEVVFAELQQSVITKKNTNRH